MKKSDLSRIMTEAWQLVKTYALTMSEALKKAWAWFKVVQGMRTGVAQFRFEKANGEVRQAFGTLSADRLPKAGGSPNRARNAFVQAYFDVEKQSFRCFKKINLIA